MAAAERCIELLKTRFGAKQVIPFGSLVGDGPWHEASDLDLAVEGVPSAALWEAERQIESIVPPWLHVDLLSMEYAYPEVRSRILKKQPMHKNPYLALKARLEDELIGLERVGQGLVGALERAGQAPEEYDIRAVATYLDDFYKCCERICERVAVELDGGLPQGEHWHQMLLGQMADSGGEGRPPLFAGSLLLELDEYRRFRHRVRHIYGYELEGDRVLELAQAVEPLLSRIREAVAALNAWLEAQAKRNVRREPHIGTTLSNDYGS